MEPRIGVTTYGRDAAGAYNLPADYVDALRRAGARVCLLPPGGADHPGHGLQDLDGLLLAGGGDIDPARYGADPHPTVYMTDADRDHTEIDLVREALRLNLPTFCICRGLQILNVALGGSLIGHLPDHLDALSHRVPPRRGALHDIQVQPRTLLSRVVAKDRLWAMSWHHQAVDRLGEGLQVNAHAPDGTIEGLELPADRHRWMLAVQWHPELTAADDPAQQALFMGFVEAARESRGR
ncbi:MAG: gamma-glutamyl-gamma-aminobutyrate hydrolase family protein [Gemmatimonadetes bacterium]|nr:gamma-glutamyl-gamma-aminobutyrate hydrolase family protein [Gemmatimonadota bacterium]MBT6149219.1 gamma-glutamyl-gamma-aminobutyrate hydrolase family protein [Gemmatimonadota bacterium]MBT7860136.1 gamma-glutamyl-gamma-aminobutyrate hydrolase family protein [Gemmatimonadota bacterium]